MANKLLADYASSVLAKIKPANLFTVSNCSYDVDGLIDQWNEKFNGLDIYFRLISRREKSSSILVYRSQYLAQSLCKTHTSCYLKSCGYDLKGIDSCIDCLAKRLALAEFPHEIGLFLGYPYEDVMGFIENKGENYIISGCWKVYKNSKEKREIFDLINKTRLIYQEAIENGEDISSLVAI